MSSPEEKQQWIDFLNSHDEFEDDFFEENVDEAIINDAKPEKQYGLTLFNGEPDGYFMAFNTEINIFQFVRLLRYFFGVDTVDVGYIDEHNHHHHIIDDEENKDTEENDDGS